jgi:hypothetical protein
MVVTLLVHLLEHSNYFAETTRVLSHKTVFLHVHFDLLFVYAMTGWEGSANNACVWADARSKNLFISNGKYYLADTGYPSCKELLTKNLFIPNGKYYLADAGYPSCKELLTPYQNVCYHLAKWGRAGARYELIS